MGSPLGPSLANTFSAYHEQNWLDKCPVEYRKKKALDADPKAVE